MDKTDIIKKYALMLGDLEYPVGECARLFLKKDGRCYATAPGADLAEFEYACISDVTDQISMEKDVLMSSREMNALIVARTPYVGICVDSGKPLHATLDDMAQIIGRVVRVVPNNSAAIAKALRKSAAVMVQGREEGCVITAGRNLYEAYVALTVLEKNAEIILKSSVIGGARPLRAGECKLMREVYKRKYSKAEREHKDDFEG